MNLIKPTVAAILLSIPMLATAKNCFTNNDCDSNSLCSPQKTMCKTNPHSSTCMELVCKPKNITVPVEPSKKVSIYSETAPDDSPAIRIQFDYPAEDKSIVAVLYGENLKKATSGIKKINIQVSECVKCSNQNRKYTHQNAELLLLNTIVNKTGSTITGTFIITNTKQNIPFSTTIMSGFIP